MFTFGVLDFELYFSDLETVEANSDSFSVSNVEFFKSKSSFSVSLSTSAVFNMRLTY
jgi:hypothetical protein